jgi:hypothetical protein
MIENKWTTENQPMESFTMKIKKQKAFDKLSNNTQLKMLIFDTMEK